MAHGTGFYLSELKIFLQEILVQEHVPLAGECGASCIFIPLHTQPVPLQVITEI